MPLNIVKKEYKNIAEDVSIDVEFEEDSYTIHKELKNTDFGNKPPIIFGTTYSEC